MDRLVPVTRPIQEGQRKRRRGTGGGKSPHFWEQTGTNSEDEGDKGFLEERSQRKRRGSSPPADIKGGSWSPPSTDRWRPARVEQGDRSRGTTMGTGRRLEEAPRGEHCAPAGRRTKTPSGEQRGGRGWTAGWDPAGGVKEARKAGEVNTLQRRKNGCSGFTRWVEGSRPRRTRLSSRVLARTARRVPTKGGHRRPEGYHHYHWG